MAFWCEDLAFFFLGPEKRSIFKCSVMQCSSPSNASCILTSFYSWKLCVDPIVLLISVLKVELYVNGDRIRSEQVFNTCSYSIYISKLPKYCHVIVFHKTFTPVTKKPSHTCRLRKKWYSWFWEPLPFPSFLEHKLHYAEGAVEKYCKVMTYSALMIQNIHHFLWI